MINANTNTNNENIYLGLGSNLEDRVKMLEAACEQLRLMPLDDFQASPIYESQPYQGMEQPHYYNQVIHGKTSLTPNELLTNCLRIEKNLGRMRRHRWEPRVIDIDILYYGNLIIETDELTIPHMDLTNRSFVLLPLIDIAPNWLDVRTGKTISTLFEQWCQTHNEPLPEQVSDGT